MKQFFVDGKGELSMMRLCQFIVVVTVVVVFITANVAMIIAAFKKGCSVEILDFKPQMIWALGVVIAGKAVQTIIGEKATQ
jgi:hypothetical protein